MTAADQTLQNFPEILGKKTEEQTKEIESLLSALSGKLDGMKAEVSKSSADAQAELSGKLGQIGTDISRLSGDSQKKLLEKLDVWMIRGLGIM